MTNHIDPENTARLKLPYLMPSQAQKHITHNEAIRLLDALVQPGVLDRDLSAPPAEPEEGDHYIVAAGASGAWTGKDSHLAAFMDGAWFMLPPVTGMLAYVVDEAKLVVWDGAAWSDAMQLQNIALLGLGTSADAANPFAAKLNKALWTAKTVAEGGDGALSYTMNKEAAGNDVGFFLQSGFVTKALIGLFGSDDFRIALSDDGSAFNDLLRGDRHTGGAEFPGNAKFAASCSFGQDYAADTWENMRFNSSTYNDQNAFSVDGSDIGIFTAPAKGLYMLGASATWENPGTSPTAWQIGLAVNGASSPAPQTIAGRFEALDWQNSGFPSLGTWALLDLDANDTVRTMIRFNGAGGRVIADRNAFFGAKVA